MRSIITITLLCFGFMALAQEKASITIESMEGPVPYSSLNLNNDPGNFQFAIVTDRTGGHRPGVFLDGILKLNLLQPEFVMSVGDLIEGYTTNVAELDRQWKEFNGFIDSLQMPFFYVPGNHDITNKVMEDKWNELYGKTYYHFKYQDVLFLCLNSEDNYRGAGRGTIDDEQYEWIKNTLEENQDAKWTLLFMHQPLWAQEAENLRWNDVEKLLANRKHTVYVGHRHSFVQYERNNGKYYILATTGGGSPLRGPELGEFDHVVWITMTDQGPIMANLQLEGIWPENMVTDKQKAFFYPMVNNNPVQVAPVLIEGPDFDEATLQVKITNNSDVPMKAELEFEYNINLLPEVTGGSYEVAPNSVEHVEVKLRAAGDFDLSQAEVLELESEVTYMPSDMPEVNVEFVNRIKPETMISLNARLGKVKVDGDLKEWKNNGISVKESQYVQSNPWDHKGEADGSFWVDVSYDQDYLYVAARVTDDDIVLGNGYIPPRQDGFHLTLDAKSADAPSSNNGLAYIATSPSKEGKKNDRVYRQNQLLEGTQVVTQTTSEGYTTEIAIPMSFIRENQGDNWKTLRLNFWMTDHDKGGDQISTIYWRPDWRGEENYAGSGTFIRK